MAEIVKYLDPEATGNGDGNSWANAYVSIAAVEAANAQLSGSGNWWHVYFRSLGGTADTTQVLWDGWTTSDTEYVLFEGIAGQRAVADGWKTDRYRWSVTNPANTMALILSDNYIYFDGMQVEMLSNHAEDALIYHSNPGLRLTNCRLRVGATAGTGITVWIYTAQNAACEAKVWNTIIEKHPSHNESDVARGWFGQLGHGDLYNCVVYGFNRGVLSNDANTDTYDSAVFNNDDDFYYVTNPGTIDYCASDDNDGTNNVAEGTTGGAAWPNVFTDAANGDFTLKVGVALIGAGGMAGSGLFSTDIDGTTRGAAWDVGAHEYVSPGTSVALTGVSGTASVGAVALSLAMALGGVLGTGAVGNLAPTTAMPLSGISVPASVGTMPPAMEAVLAGIAALGEAGTVTPSGSVTLPLTGNSAPGAVGTVSPTPTVAISGVSANPAYPVSGVSATGTVGNLDVLNSSITLPLTGVSAGPAYPLSSVAAIGEVGTIVYAEETADIPISGVAATGELGTVAPSGGAPEGAAMTGSVGSVAVAPAIPVTGNAGTGAVGTSPPARSKALSGLSAPAAIGTVGVVITHEGDIDVALTSIAGTGQSGAVVPKNTIAFSGVTGAGAVGTPTTAAPCVCVPLEPPWPAGDGDVTFEPSWPAGDGDVVFEPPWPPVC